MTVFTMQINGGEIAECSALGWAVDSITRRNLAPDALSMSRLHDGAVSIASGDKVVIFADGARIYTGTAQPPRISRAATGATVSVQVLGPWWHMDQTPFSRTQSRVQGSGATATATISAGSLTSISVTAGGSGYLPRASASYPRTAFVLFSGGGGTGCAAEVIVNESGVVSSISVTAGGSGFTSAPTLIILGTTQLPMVLGDTFSIGPGDGVEIYNPSTGEFETPASPTTYKWAREDDFGATPIELDMARYIGLRGLFFDPDWSAHSIYRTVAREVIELLEYMRLTRERHASEDRPDLTPVFATDLAGVETGLGASASPRYRTFSDQKVGSLLAQLLATKPDVAGWFDYSLEVPEFFLRVASLETEQTLTLGAPPLLSLEAVPRPDLLPAGVVVRWEFPTDTVADWRGYRLPAHTDKSPADILPHEPGVITHTLDFSEDITEFKPQLAQSLMDSLGTLRASGSMTMGGLSVHEALALRPGLCYRLEGDAMLSAAQLLVQETSWNASTNQVRCTLGYPRALDIQTFRDLQGWLKFTFYGPLETVQSIVPPPP